MTNYASIKNTSKNKKLIRAEIREYTLCMGLTRGFYKNHLHAAQYYPKNPHRQKQYRNLVVKIPLMPRESDFLNKYVLNFDKILVTVMTHYYNYEKVIEENSEQFYFWDTKKFRIYNDRIMYGHGGAEVRLLRIIQYLYTPCLLTTLFCYGFCFSDSLEHSYLLLDKNYFCRYPYNREETLKYMKDYINSICHLEVEFDRNTAELLKKPYFLGTNSMTNSYIYNITFPDKQSLMPYIEVVNKYAEETYKKLVKAKQIPPFLDEGDE